MQEAFDSWDMLPVPIPARSRLHSIEPIGVGTPFVENLWLPDPACRLARGACKRPDRTRASDGCSFLSRASGNFERNQWRQRERSELGLCGRTVYCTR